jgi:hypothetical protein
MFTKTSCAKPAEHLSSTRKRRTAKFNTERRRGSTEKAQRIEAQSDPFRRLSTGPPRWSNCQFHGCHLSRVSQCFLCATQGLGVEVESEQAPGSLAFDASTRSDAFTAALSHPATGDLRHAENVRCCFVPSKFPRGRRRIGVRVFNCAATRPWRRGLLSSE